MPRNKLLSLLGLADKDVAAQVFVANGANPMISGNYVTVVGTGSGASTGIEGNARGGFLTVGRNCTIDKLGVEIVTAGTAGALVRLGLYVYDPGTDTLTLLADAGTIDGTQAPGYYEKSLTVPVGLKAGQVICPVACWQGAAATRTGLRTRTSALADEYAGGTGPMTLSGNAFQATSPPAGTGALPATLANAMSLNGTAGSPPTVLMHVV